MWKAIMLAAVIDFAGISLITMSIPGLSFLAPLIFLTCIQTASRGDIFREVGDAGDRPAKAMVLPPGVNHIKGSLKPGTTGVHGNNPVDVDLYIFSLLSRPGRFEIRFPSTGGFERPGLLLFYKNSTGYVFHDLSTQSSVAVDATLVQGALQGTFCLAVGDRSISPYYPDQRPFFPFTNQAPIVFVGASSAQPDITKGQAYDILFNFKTEVTGVNLTVGERFTPLAQKGVTIVDEHGKGQTISVSGHKTAHFKFQLHLHNESGPTSLKIDLPKNLELRKVWFHGGAANVTASFRSGRYLSNLGYGNIDSYTVKVGSAHRSLSRLSNWYTQGIREKIFTRASLVSKPGYRDVVGTVVNLNPVR